MHVAGTDFDRQIELGTILPTCGFKGRGPTGREVPNRVYFDLATWHLINTVYAPARVHELKGMRSFYAQERQYERLMRVVEERLGHALIGLAEAAKIAVADGGDTSIDLSALESGLAVPLDEKGAIHAIDAEMEQIAGAADETLRQAGLQRTEVKALYFTGGSTGFHPLAERIATAFPAARVVRGNRYASVAQGLGVHAGRVFG